jgi:DedD protein
VLSLPQRKDNPAGNADEAASVLAARTRARRRLLGAAVLVGLGIVGFPLLFETQPRPIPVDIPIEVGPRASSPAPAPQAVRPASAPAAAVVRAQPAAPVESEADVPNAASAPAPAPAPASVAAPPMQPTAQAASAAAETERDAQRAQALLEGKPVAAPPAAAEPKPARFVVQAGAYTDAGALREARQKVEKLGLKTYTQVVETDSGARTRVRVGPFENRDEAEKAAARIKSAGLAANVLSL